MGLSPDFKEGLKELKSKINFILTQKCTQMERDKSPMTKRKEKFLENYKEINDNEALKQILYAQSLQVEKLEKIRFNLSILVWWIVGIPIITFLFFLIYGGFGALS